MRDWSDEPWVKLYTRDNPDWVSMPWQAKVVLLLALKGKFDRAGYLDLGRRGVESIGSIVGLPDEVAQVGLDYLLKVDKGWSLIHRDDRIWIFWQNYLPAQTAVASDKVRKAMQREKDRAQSAAETLSPEEVQDVLNGGQEALDLGTTVTPGGHVGAVTQGVSRQAVTPGGHAGSVTPGGHDQNRIDEKRSDQPKSAFTDARDRLCVAFQEKTGRKYLWQGAKDSTALKSILSVSTPAEAERAFRLGLNIAAADPKDWKAVTSVAQLHMKWNDLIALATTSKPRLVQNANDFKLIKSLDDVKKVHDGP